MGVVAFDQDELGRHVEDGSDVGARLHDVLVLRELLGEPEVSEFGVSLAEEDVLRLNVAMDNVVVVEEGDCGDNAPDDF